MSRCAPSRDSARPRSTSRMSARTRGMHKARRRRPRRATRLQVSAWAAHATLPPMEPQERVRTALAALGLPSEIVCFDGTTATAQEAADAVGCELGQIVKTLFFLADGRPTIALVAGDRQVDTSALAELLGVGRKKLKMGAPTEVLEFTGFQVGGVAPVGHLHRPDVVVDESLGRFERVWAAAGAHNAVFEAVTRDLVAAIHGQWAAITKEPA
ncbi:YbaK/EbsC family protein [bacterium]|nr:MAG: YbaK/EbsC family protein [bacterium]